MSYFRLLNAVCGCASHRANTVGGRPHCKHATNAYYQVVEYSPDGRETILAEEVRYDPGLRIVKALSVQAHPMPTGFMYPPEKCPSNHWNRGDDICADCGANLQ